MIQRTSTLTVLVFTLALGLAAAASAAPSPGPQAVGSLSARFSSSGLALQFVFAFLAGLALNLTPCVYPLIPITVGFFMAQKTERRVSTWLLAVTYVLGMSVTYSALGVTAAVSGRLFGAAMQSPWVIAIIVLVMLALAASMFGLWELRVPAWATRVSGGRGGVGGALIMGLVVGLVAAPCIGPFVLGLLTYVSQRQDVLLGFLLFFALSLGLGLPYLLLGVFTGVLDRMPNSGAWMLGARQLFGVILVALAGYFSRPLVPEPWNGWLLPVLLLVGGTYLLAIARPAHEQPSIDRFMRLASAALLVAGVLLAPGRVRREAAASWQPYDEAVVAQALASGQPVIMDFWATWCLPCKELDEKTFSDPEVASRLGGFRLFKVDLSRSDAASDALRSRYGVAGVPTLVFYRTGTEVTDARLTGFEDADAFLKRLSRVTGR